MSSDLHNHFMSEGWSFSTRWRSVPEPHTHSHTHTLTLTHSHTDSHRVFYLLTLLYLLSERRGLDALSKKGKTSTLDLPIESVSLSLQDLIGYFQPPDEHLEHEDKQNRLRALKSRQNLFQEEVRVTETPDTARDSCHLESELSCCCGRVEEAQLKSCDAQYTEQIWCRTNYETIFTQKLLVNITNK